MIERREEKVWWIRTSEEIAGSVTLEKGEISFSAAGIDTQEEIREFYIALSEAIAEADGYKEAK
jgi:phage host-nuclease inhibitor protein Gam